MDYNKYSIDDIQEKIRALREKSKIVSWTKLPEISCQIHILTSLYHSCVNDAGKSRQNKKK